MILLSCAKMPDGLDKNTLATTVGLLFPHPENIQYIEDIRSRKNASSACEGLFALAILYEKIIDLSCPDVDTATLIFTKNKNGKPFFKDSNLKFNVSHSKGYIACAVSIDEELGVDVEASGVTPERAIKLAERYFSEQTAKAVISAPEIFTRFWSKKEAEAKFFGESIGNILSDFKKEQKKCENTNICFHRFAYDNIPITLCTKRDFSTIIFTAQ